LIIFLDNFELIEAQKTIDLLQQHLNEANGKIKLKSLRNNSFDLF
jgi:nicotinate-nucleotide pyrophosphorylase